MTMLGRRRGPWWGPRRGAFDNEAAPMGWGPAFTYGGPWAITIGGWPAIETTHLLVQDTPTAMSLTALAMSGAGYGIAALMRRLDIRAKVDTETRIAHTVNCTALSVGAVGGTVAGLDSAFTAGTWFLTGFSLSIANNVWSKFGSSRRGKGEKTSKWARLEENLGLAKHEVQEVNTNGRGTVFADIEAKDGATAEDLARKIPAMAAALHVGQGRITHTTDEDDSSKIRLRIQSGDFLKAGRAWRGPSAFGASIADSPLRYGFYEDGEDTLINIVGPAMREPGPVPSMNVEHAIAMGTNGAGKTFGVSVILTDAMTRSEVSVVVIDVSKPDQDYGHIRHGVDLFIRDTGEARRFFKVMPDVIKARTDALARGGHKTWTPGCGLNFVIIVAEEAADYAADSRGYQKILRTARSAGIWIITSIQRATHNNIDTDARANSPAGLCFGLRDGADAQYCLPDEAIDQGAWPQWANRKPGYHYLAGLGTPEDRWAVAARTELGDPAELAAAVTAAASIRTPLDEVTATAFGELWRKREVFDAPLLADDDPGQEDAPSPRPGPPAAAPPAPPRAEAGGWPPDETDHELDDEDAAREVEELEDAMATEVGELEDMLQDVLDADPEPGEYQGLTLETAVPDPDEEEAPVLDLGHPTPPEERLTTDQARDAIHQRLDGWLRGGKQDFYPRELNDILLRVDIGDSRRWFYRLRDRLITDGVISEDESDDGFGRYDIHRSPLT
ncbi:hypothetical protein [Streptomyces triticirhizae]|uniref:FtsK domain-containing protein n=1 Tax=Streptomyces triticirhizae TaxID=2483353 RepID=A0A3M2LXN9_9ACTN|nr:hypothetical protein [Streptomyces triticirhizae]RMI39748.1 hypothetical protein EBN88_14250 [Streptomyces triticirhizae]